MPTKRFATTLTGSSFRRNRHLKARNRWKMQKQHLEEPIAPIETCKMQHRPSTSGSATFAVVNCTLELLDAH